MDGFALSYKSVSMVAMRRRHVQSIEASVQHAVNSRTAAVLEGFVAPVEKMGLGGRNIKRSPTIGRSSAKLLEESPVNA